MILREATIRYKGYDPEDLKPYSEKKVCVSCDICGRVRWIYKFTYKPLCQSCCKLGKNNPIYGKHHTKETRKKMSDNHVDFKGKNHPNYRNYKLAGKNNPMFGKRGKNHPAWKGGLPLRDHVLNEKNCIQLNKKFEGSEGHHILSGVIIYLPKNLHNRKYGISHNMKTGKGMNEINELAFNFLMGDI